MQQDTIQGGCTTTSGCPKAEIAQIVVSTKLTIDCHHQGHTKWQDPACNLKGSQLWLPPGHHLFECMRPSHWQGAMAETLCCSGNNNNNDNKSPTLINVRQSAMQNNNGRELNPRCNTNN